MPDVPSPKLPVSSGTTSRLTIVEQKVATVVDLRLERLRRSRRQRRGFAYNLILSSLVATASSDRSLVTCYSDPELIDRIALVLAIPDVADSGNLQDQEITSPIANKSGRAYLWLSMFRCCVFYSIHRDTKNVEIQAVFRDDPGPNKPGGIRLDPVEQFYLRLISNYPLGRPIRPGRTIRRAIGGIAIAAVCLAGMEFYSISKQTQTAMSILAPISVSSDVRLQKYETQDTTFAYKSDKEVETSSRSNSSAIGKWDRNKYANFESRWSAVIGKNAQWAEFVPKVYAPNVWEIPRKVAKSFSAKHAVLSSGRNLSARPHLIATPALPREQSLDSDLRKMNYVALNEGPPPPVEIALIAITHDEK